MAYFYALNLYFSCDVKGVGESPQNKKQVLMNNACFLVAGAISPKRCLWQKKRGEIGSVSQRYAKENEQTDNETSGRRREPEG